MSAWYPYLKQVHIACAVLSVSGFGLRAAWALAESPLLLTRVAKILPHVIDTVLLASAIWLALLLQQYPFTHGWLTAKIAGLMAYIFLGMIALRFARTVTTRVIATALALLVFAWIASVARSHTPLGFLSERLAAVMILGCRAHPYRAGFFQIDIDKSGQVFDSRVLYADRSLQFDVARELANSMAVQYRDDRRRRFIAYGRFQISDGTLQMFEREITLPQCCLGNCGPGTGWMCRSIS